ncbi:MAG: manB [Candidatus Taylorbacteria bacterium]|nr:manB [Candidatus Taylorbacteria bacterium]
MEYKNIYIDFLKEKIKVGKPLTVVFDASNGPAGMIIKDLFVDTSVNAIVINDEIDPDFKAHGPNPLLPGASDQCKKMILENSADLGVMFDADADRAFFLDDKGEMIPACFVVGLLKSEFNPPYILDELVYQSVRLLKLVEEDQMVPSRIGAYFIKETLRGQNADFGAEYSGHYYFKEFFNADSGIFAAITFLNSVSKMTKSLSEWQKEFEEHIVTTKEIKTEGKDMSVIYREVEKFLSDKAKGLDRRDGLTFIFDDFWMNVRSSNTEPILRIVAGGKGMEETTKEIEQLITGL